MIFAGDWETRVSLGQWPDTVAVTKFGRNPAVGTTEEDIWEPGGLQNLIAVGVTMYASCEDNVNGVGQVLFVEGLDENWDIQEGQVILNGQAQVAVTKEDGSAATWTRIHRAYQISAEPDPVGDVWFAESDTLTLGVPDTATKVHAFINFTQAAQQTQQVGYTIPRNYVGVLYHFEASVLKAATGARRSPEVGIEIQNLAEGATAESPTWAPWRRLYTVALDTEGGVAHEQSFRVPLVFPELTNVNARATAASPSDVFALYELVLIPTT
jgi:hypothetical protein